MFEVKYSNQATKFLKKLDKVLVNRLMNKIEELKITPILRETVIVVGYKERTYRVRVGDYRILYEVDKKLNLIGIVKVDKRPRAYGKDGKRIKAGNFISEEEVKKRLGF